MPRLRFTAICATTTTLVFATAARSGRLCNHHGFGWLGKAEADSRFLEHARQEDLEQPNFRWDT